MEKSGEKRYAETSWPVFEAGAYELYGREGFRFIGTPFHTASMSEVRTVDPLAPEYAGLFLEFARWFDTQEMEKAKDDFTEGIHVLDTRRNAKAALAWTRKYGVLGLGKNLNESWSVGCGKSSSSEIAAERLGMPQIGLHGTRAYRKSAGGGKHETIEAFAHEAYEANIVLKLYEAATGAPDVAAIARFMSNRETFLHRWKKYRRIAKTEREMWSEDPEQACWWALSVVENAVSRKVEEDVYPILLGEPDSYESAWGFKSLLGGMWLQMRYFMLAQDNLCENCALAFEKTRRDRKYCSRKCADSARSKRNYHEDRGASGRTARKRKRLRGNPRSDTT